MSQIYECHCRFWQQMTFTDRNSTDSCFRFTFIYGSENPRSHDIFSFKLSVSIRLFSSPWGVDILQFSKNHKKEAAWWGRYFVILPVSVLRHFCGNFQGKELIEQMWRLLLSFLIFFVKLFNRSFLFVWSHLLLSCNLSKTFIYFNFF